jgi:hypothetical protein
VIIHEREHVLFSFIPFRTVFRIGSATVKRAVVCVGIVLCIVPAAGAFQLITEQESALPDDLTGNRRGGPTRGPDIVFVSPKPEAGLLKSPLNLTIRFKAHGGARIDRDSVLITYKKVPAVDLTQRLLPFIRADGMEVVGAELPPGAHRLRIDVQDTDGRSTTDYLVITVAK